MRRPAPGILFVLAFLALSVSGARLRSSASPPPDPRLVDADLAWDRGDYPAALRAYLALLDAPDADDVLPAIALQTGELYRTTELTTDGGAPRFSPDGRHVSYETGRGIRRRTRVVPADAPASVIAELPGHGASFSPDGAHLVYLKLPVTREMLDAEAAAAAASGTDRTAKLGALGAMTESAARITIRHVQSGVEREVDAGAIRKTAVRLAGDDLVVFTGFTGDQPEQLYVAGSRRRPAALTSGADAIGLQAVNAPGTAALFTYRPRPRRDGSAPTGPRFGVATLPEGRVTAVAGSAPGFSPDGRDIVYVHTAGDRTELRLAPVSAPASALAVRTGPERLDRPAVSGDGRRLAFQIMAAHDWEIHTIGRDGTGEARVTREIQHDVLPRFLADGRLLGLAGEPRHRRSFVYDLAANTRTRLFHNDTVRTIVPEYDWAPAPDGTRILVVAERDGDTVSPERGVYLVDLTTTVTRADVRRRLATNLAAEEALRARGARLYDPIADEVARVVDGASVARVYGYQKALFDFDSKHISRPGNRLASAYLFEAYASFGYGPEYQWLTHSTALDGRTANVFATLKGTINPSVVYVVSSHYDSVQASPGADDNSSGTAALLEAARLLARHPQPATIVFASFTGEESGLLGSREFVRRAAADGVRIAGALNNDMLGWANDHRLDATIRYSNDGIRDIQHAAAMRFTRLITYDTRYYRGTDAIAYYEAFGDIVGGFGAYPILGSPHYHQPHDVLETMNHQLVTEVARATAATVMRLASSPSRLRDLRIDAYRDGIAAVSWTPSPESDVSSYVVAWGPPASPEAQQVRVTQPAASIRTAPGSVVAVKAINERGLDGWDWARTTIEP